MRTRVALALLICSLINALPLQAGFAESIFGTNIVIIAHPDSVQAWRTVGSLRQSHNPDDYYEKSGNGVLVSSDKGQSLSKTFLRRDTYLGTTVHAIFIPMSQCMPQPGVIIMFSKGNRSVNLYLCFECNILRVNVDRKNPNQRPVPPCIDFDPPELARIMKTIFPDDQQIQRLGSGH